MSKKIETRKYRDRREYMIRAVSKRRRELKEKAVKLKGGKCEICGYKKCLNALDFHHIDESKKSFSLGTRGLTRSWEKIVEEIQKCMLLCANCHREIHAGLIDISKLSHPLV
ncbi:MAG: HNH endonuclease [Candidatus Moraniibacteriota bacterium]|nr:MAG: HNH endonuclease [Candidatus Moranbacteria bacterium]